MKISLHSNINSFIRDIKKQSDVLQEKTKSWQQKIGRALVKEAQKSMLETKTGITYRFRGGYHTASAPLEALASMTGKARKSITYHTTGNILYFGANNIAIAVWEQSNKATKRPTLELSINKNIPIYKSKLGNL